MKPIDTATVRRMLKLEKKKLRERREQDFDNNRARYSAASEDSVSRVLMLEELLATATAPAPADVRGER